MIAKQDQFASRVSDILTHSGRMLIGDAWTRGTSHESITVLDPGSGEVLSEYSAASSDDVDASVTAAATALPGWQRMSPLARAQLLWRIADLFDDHRDELALLEVLDTGKPLANARDGDIQAVIDEFRYMSGLAARLNGAVAPLAAAPGGVFHSYTSRTPVGVVAAIVPWNYPLAGAAWKIAPALACGNTMVLKTSEETPLATMRAAELMVEGGLPQGVFNVITGGARTGTSLVTHPGVDKITFTGSTTTGKRITELAARNITPVALELGGKSPNVIFADADLPAAVAGAASGIFYDSGEVCSAGSRLYVEASVFPDVLAGLQDAAAAMPVGHGLSPDTVIGPLISAKHLRRVARYVDDARDAGVEVAFGGQPVEGAGFFYPPTALVGAEPDAAIVREEVFGPVVTVHPFADLPEVIGLANDTRYGLAAGVWTRDIQKAHAFSESVRAGVVWVNTYGVTDPALQWGGFKHSGWGRENGDAALHEFTATKTVCMQVGRANQDNA